MNFTPVGTINENCVSARSVTAHFRYALYPSSRLMTLFILILIVILILKMAIEIGKDVRMRNRIRNRMNRASRNDSEVVSESETE